MRNNVPEQEKNIEKLLKSKMHELSCSVDCFDKIESRAFPEKNADFFPDGSTITDIENVTGRRRRFPVLKVTALAAALVLIFGIVPHTAVFRDFSTGIFNKGRVEQYHSIIKELEEELNSGSYDYFDAALDDYIKYDVLYTPMYACPFDISENEDARVRVFMKKVGTTSSQGGHDIYTNQLYAVEYIGTYEEENFVAAACSGAKFGAEDMVRLTEQQDGGFKFGTGEQVCFNTAATILSAQNERTVLNGKNVSAASFDYYCFFKDGENICPLTASILYYRSGTGRTGSYYYDMSAFCYENGTVQPYDVRHSTKNWQTSLYYNGSSAMPANSRSSFSRTNLFGSVGMNVPNTDICCASFSTESEKEAVKVDEHKIIVPVVTSDALCGLMGPCRTKAFSEVRFYLGLTESLTKRNTFEVRDEADGEMLSTKTVHYNVPNMTSFTVEITGE